jgi:predicted Zn finger-like uncharacterized protein
MAGSKITCPECDTVLKFSKPVAPGKKVKCSNCETVFKAPEEEAPVSKGKAKAKAEASAGKDKAKKTADKVTAKKPGDKPAKEESKPAKPAGDEEEKFYGVIKEDEEESEKEKEKKPKIDYTQETAVKDLRGPAQALVIKPTNMLLLFGALGFFGYVGLFIALMIPIVTPLSSDVGTSAQAPVVALEIGPGVGMLGNDQPVNLPGKNEDLQLFLLFGQDLAQIAFYHWWQIVLFMAPLIFGAFWSLVAIMGAVKAQNIESRGWGIASAIMMMLPIMIAGFTVDVMLAGNFVLGMLVDESTANYMVTMLAIIIPIIPFGVGIWALVVFCNKDVIAGFEYVPD